MAAGNAINLIKNTILNPKQDPYKKGSFDYEYFISLLTYQSVVTISKWLLPLS